MVTALYVATPGAGSERRCSIMRRIWIGAKSLDLWTFVANERRGLLRREGLR
jgi:hypothetical protein